MPDGLHPNAAGMELMAECLEARIAKLMAEPVTAFAAATPPPGGHPQALDVSKPDAGVAASAA